MDDAIGIAFVGVMCSPSSVGISQTNGYSMAAVGSIVSHELGHILGMDHDDDRKLLMHVYRYVL